MKARPILMNTEMVQAVLEGRKTQTRRLIKTQPIYNSSTETWWWERTKRKEPARNVGFLDNGDGSIMHQFNPFGNVGDLLYVRETFGDYGLGKVFRADDNLVKIDLMTKWKPSIHMPRAISRITLEIKDIRIERLQDITTDDAVAEGIRRLQGGARVAFEGLWESIEGEGSWKSNPWVWVIEFKVHKINVDDFIEANNDR